MRFHHKIRPANNPKMATNTIWQTKQCMRTMSNTGTYKASCAADAYLPQGKPQQLECRVLVLDSNGEESRSGRRGYRTSAVAKFGPFACL